MSFLKGRVIPPTMQGARWSPPAPYPKPVCMRALLLLLLLAACAAACSAVRFDVQGASSEPAYVAEHPYYAEYCALSQIKKKPGFGADIRGEIGGHAVFYLNGARAIPGYPTLALGGPSDGAGLSMNEHFTNAKWVATPGRAFFFQGGLIPGEPLTRDRYATVQAEAKRLGIYNGVTFHDIVFEPMPPSWTRDDWKYEMSVATDYAVALGRGRYCARVPVTRDQMALMIEVLNEQNAPYREGRRVFRWSVFNDNCIHLAHNALAAAGLWDVWPTERFLPLAILDFPVPRNEFVNLMRRTNDAWLPDPGAVYADLPARHDLLRHHRLPSLPGALAEAQGPITPNDIYETRLKMIFYDDPILGHYQPRFDRIFADPRYLDAQANRAYFAALARDALANRQPLSRWLAHPPWRNDPAGFTAVYEAYWQLLETLAK